MIGTSSTVSATAPVTASYTSNYTATGARDSVTRTRATRSVTMPTGAFTKDTTRQPDTSTISGCVINQPPMIYETDTATPCTAPMIPNARCRASLSNSTRDEAITWGMGIAVPKP